MVFPHHVIAARARKCNSAWRRWHAGRTSATMRRRRIACAVRSASLLSVDRTAAARRSAAAATHHRVSRPGVASSPAWRTLAIVSNVPRRWFPATAPTPGGRIPEGASIGAAFDLIRVEGIPSIDVGTGAKISLQTRTTAGLALTRLGAVVTRPSPVRRRLVAHRCCGAAPRPPAVT